MKSKTAPSPIYQPVIGLEIHVELKTKTKMFCSCKNDSKEIQPNLNICPICLGHAGVLPSINKEAVLMVIKTGQALNCKIQDETFFERKNYFYPDLPKGYQISQYKAPICKDGFLNIWANPHRNSQKFAKIRIQRIHLEEDTAKLLHPEGEEYSLVDFNRAGIPLMELVTEPDIRSTKEARNFAQELQLILRYLEVSNADMEKGEMRVEVNISLVPERDNKKRKTQKLGTKVEIKNLNSFLAVEKAINFEINRQKEILNKGQKIIQETRGWDEARGETLRQRIKEESKDYRYFPEPDLPPLQTPDLKSQASKYMPELPQQKKERFQKEYNLSDREADILIKDKKFSDYFEKVISELKNWQKIENVPQSKLPSLIKMAVNYFQVDLLGLMKENKKEIGEIKITPENFAELITLLWKREISSRAGKLILEEMFQTGADPTYIIKDKNLKQVSDERKIKEIIKRVIKDNQKAVEDYKKGRKNAIQFLIGQVMRETKGKMDPRITQKLIQEELMNLSQKV